MIGIGPGSKGTSCSTLEPDLRQLLPSCLCKKRTAPACSCHTINLVQQVIGQHHIGTGHAHAGPPLLHTIIHTTLGKEGLVSTGAWWRRSAAIVRRYLGATVTGTGENMRRGQRHAITLGYP